MNRTTPEIDVSTAEDMEVAEINGMTMPGTSAGEILNHQVPKASRDVVDLINDIDVGPTSVVAPKEEMLLSTDAPLDLKYTDIGPLVVKDVVDDLGQYDLTDAIVCSQTQPESYNPDDPVTDEPGEPDEPATELEPDEHGAMTRGIDDGIFISNLQSEVSDDDADVDDELAVDISNHSDISENLCHDDVRHIKNQLDQVSAYETSDFIGVDEKASLMTSTMQETTPSEINTDNHLTENEVDSKTIAQSQIDSETSVINDHVTDPDDHVTDPDDHVTDPDDHTTDPDDHVTDPDDHTTDPDDHVTDPDDPASVTEETDVKEVIDAVNNLIGTPPTSVKHDSEIDYSEETSNGSAELENMNGSLSSIKRSSKIEDLLQKQMHKSDSVERINAPCQRQTSSASPAVNGSLRGSRTGSYDRLGRQSSPYSESAASYRSPDKFGGSIDRLAISRSRNNDVKHSSPKMSPRTHSSSHGDIPNNSSYHSERFPKRDIDSKKYVSEQVLNSPLNSDAPFHRVGSSQSNPTPTPPHKYNAFDDRSMTPDTYYRTVGGYPGIKTPLITSRASLASHQSSTHTLTPTVLNGDGHRNPSPNEAAGYDIRVTDLENRLFNANQGLEDQAIEITRLRHQIQDMESENNVLMREVDRERRKHAPSVHQDDNSKLIAEKEALATEVMKLTSEIELLQSEQRHSDSGDSHHSIDKYSPDNPNALKRQIEELKSQVQDLQEANESAALELNTMEQRLNENESLKAANDSCLEDLEKENESLRDQIRDLKKKSTQYLNSSSDRTREEMKCLRLDMRKLRERNGEVNEENLKLRDQLTELRLRAERKSKKPETPLITNGYSHNTHNHEFTSPKIERTVSGTVEGIVDSTDRLRKVEKYLEDNRFYAAEDILYDGKKNVDTSEIEPMYAKHNSYLVHSNRFEPKARRTLTLDGIENIEPKGDPLLTDRSDSTAFLTSNQFTRMFEPIDINENDLVEYPKRYPYPSSARSATSVGSNKMPPIKQKGTTQMIYLGDDLRSPRSNFNDSFDTPRNLPRQNLTESFNLKTINGEDDDEDSTSSILSEVERELGIPTKHLRTNSSKTKRRSKSPDATPQELSAVGFRSISPRPIATQHNKGSLASPRDAKLITSGMHPYVPRSPADVKIGSVVKFSRQTGQISRGLVRFIGHLPGRDDTYLGLELENEDGKHDGTYNNVRYFACKPNKGVFVTFNKVVMAWVSY